MASLGTKHRTQAIFVARLFLKPSDYRDAAISYAIKTFSRYCILPLYVFEKVCILYKSTIQGKSLNAARGLRELKELRALRGLRKPNKSMVYCSLSSLSPLALETPLSREARIQVHNHRMPVNTRFSYTEFRCHLVALFYTKPFCPWDFIRIRNIRVRMH